MFGDKQGWRREEEAREESERKAREEREASLERERKVREAREAIAAREAREGREAEQAAVRAQIEVSPATALRACGASACRVLRDARRLTRTRHGGASNLWRRNRAILSSTARTSRPSPVGCYTICL